MSERAQIAVFAGFMVVMLLIVVTVLSAIDAHYHCADGTVAYRGWIVRDCPSSAAAPEGESAAPHREERSDEK